MTTLTPTDNAIAPVSRDDLMGLLERQRKAYLAEGVASAETRISRIDRLLLAVVEAADALAESLGGEYGSRPPALTKALDILGCVGAAQELRDNISKWMEPEVLAGGFIQRKPLGVVGIIGAWNFPIELTIHPAINALAAGNRVMIKFPDFHPKTGAILAAAVAEHLSPEEVTVVIGDLETAQAFSDLPFDHIVFTGSPAIGRRVAEAAGRNLVPTTLELGGKNPVVVAEDADIDLAAHRIAGTRMLNGGQVCLCPDYVFVPRSQREGFVDKLVGELQTLYPDYATDGGVVSIVNDRNFDRVSALVEDAVGKGAQKVTVTTSQEPNDGERRIVPTVLVDVPEDATIAEEEVFGPVVSIHVYDELDEVIGYINSRPSPLAAYWFGGQGDEFQRFLAHATSGGVTANDIMTHQMLGGAPFGGVGNSGTGAYHGKSGFDRFTHMRTVAIAEGDAGVSDGLVGPVLETDEFSAVIDATVAGARDDLRARVAGGGGS
ncbi:aldehyde dehydrogenase family protein [Gordonia sp. CPCC 205515]|uniref:aldehyde dehydrogenase family protein n=1 Tax=Gordonia sp. CPCC 205515 TaxID=3140791 RepID=UPI003AF35992